jgi:hypothetical protein
LSLFFLARVVSSLAYPNLLGNKILGCCCGCIVLLMYQGWFLIIFWPHVFTFQLLPANKR